MAVQGTSQTPFSSFYSYFFPDKIHAPKHTLLEHRARLTKASNIAQASLLGFGSLFLWKGYESTRRNKNSYSWVDTAALTFSAGTAVLLAKATQWIFEEMDHIDILLKAEELPFEELYFHRILDRIDSDKQRIKFQEMFERIVLKCPEAKKRIFLQMSKELNLLKLNLEKVAIPVHCRYENYGIQLREVLHDELEALFPLRANSAAQLELPKNLQKESKRQEELYQKLKAASDQCRLRGLELEDSAIHQAFWEASVMRISSSADM